MTDIHYEKTEHGIALKDGKELLKFVDRIGIFFSLPTPEDEHQTVTLHKHGEYKHVKEIKEEHERKYREAGFNDLAETMDVIDVADAPMEDINAVLAGCGRTVKNFRVLAQTLGDKSVNPEAQNYTPRIFSHKIEKPPKKKPPQGPVIHI